MPSPATDHHEIKKGALLGGKYRLEREIGRGAMGTVWAALHVSLQQRVAIKIISPEHAHSDELRKRFDTEARAAAKLRSRFVVTVSDNGLTESGVPYIVMEYLEGECLEDRVARLGCLSPGETSRVARHVARALSRAHARGIVHRDLKPANIFLARSEDDQDTDDWTAKVLDFGIAKMEDFSDHSTTKTGAVLGTPLFMSPEQVRGASSVDARADLYSFGMVIYNMLTGTHAFEGQSFGDLLVSICTDPLPDLTKSAPSASPELNRWFQKACARDPDNRYQSAGDLMKAFSEAIGELPDYSRLSMTDQSGVIDSAALPVTGAETLSANTRSSVELSHVDTGASALTVNLVPQKSRLPAILAAVALAVGALTVFSLVRAPEPEAPVIAQPATMPSPLTVETADPAHKDMDPTALAPDVAIEGKTNTAKASSDSEVRDPANKNTQSLSAEPVIAPRPQVKPEQVRPQAASRRVIAETPVQPGPQPQPKAEPLPQSTVPDLGF